MMLQLENVTFTHTSRVFAPRKIFSNANLVINDGENVIVIGEEGAGKSTLLQLLDGLLQPDAGIVRVNGMNVWDDPKRLPSIRSRIGFAFQFPEQQFFCETVRDELCFALRNFGLIGNEREKARLTLSEVGLSERCLDASPFSLSMGEARRVALASILVHEPEAILLDEPTAGLDGKGIGMTMNLLAKLKKKGSTIVIATHERDLFSSIVDSVVKIEDGKLEKLSSIAS